MKITINIFSKNSVDAAADKLRRYAALVKKLEEELPKRLVAYGVPVAQVLFDNAAYDIDVGGLGTHPEITVTAEPRENGYAVVANGQEVCFVEFGAGVFFNGSGGTYKGTRPPEIVGIGEYGKGYGKRRAWAYVNEAGIKVIARGTPASNSMYFTAQEMRARIAETAKEILNGND